MPGIHVRTSSKIDWSERQTTSVLTVPGSYWLCHKKNIYKFTFKYDRNSRIKEFNHEKELLKVIRRIIKLQPRQGQQFGTRRLLVTYNHTPWTRQDKMFATLKFRDRPNASAFSHAFILKIRIISIDQDSKINNNQRTNKLNDNKLIVCNDKQDYDLNWIVQDKLDSINENKNNLLNLALKNEIDVDVDSKSVLSCKNTKKRKNSSPLPISNDTNKLPRLEKIMNKSDDISIEQDNLNEVQETVDMPYQYLIEKDIERTKILTKSTSSPVSNINTTSDINKITNSIRENGKLDTKRNGRSSDITDLVMGGLMFTIRQDQDSLTVVEQKTKLVPDEVLENSEKIETKEGVEGLINSSLMKLENLVTKIEVPCNLENNTNKLSLCDKNDGVNSDDLVNESNQTSIDEDLNISPSVSPSPSDHDDTRDSENESIVTDEENPTDADNEEHKMEADKNNCISKTCDTEKLTISVPTNVNCTDDTPPNTPKKNCENTLKDKPNSPRIISYERVKYDLSTFRSVKIRRKLVSNECYADCKDGMFNGNLDDDSSVLNGNDNEMVQTVIITNKNNITPRQLFSNNHNDVRKEKNNTLQLWKFLQDMTHGVRVVLNRLDLSQVIKNNSCTIDE